MKKVAFVVQRCGLEVNGGAETLCLTISKQMSKYWDVEILTTCALDYITWENHYSPGLTHIGVVKIRRFPVAQPRNIDQFNRLSEEILRFARTADLDVQEAWMKAQGPFSPDLIDYVDQHKHDYDAFLFFTYLYATTYFVLPLVAEKAYLVPLAHDEWTIYLSMWESFFKKPVGFVFNTVEEQNFLKRRFPSINLDGPVTGVAVTPPAEVNADRFRQEHCIHESFLLYVGRIDPSKGCEELFEYFLNYRSVQSNNASRSQEQTPKKLVLLGKSTMSIPKHPDIISLGFVDEGTKWNALAACDLLIMPSPYESLSIVLLEAWAVGKSALVNGRCEVLVGQCRRAQGGVWYTSADEFQVALERLTEEVKAQLGIQGKQYIKHHYVWSSIEKKYLSLLSSAI